MTDERRSDPAGGSAGRRYTYLELDGAHFRREENGVTRGVHDVLRDGKWVPYEGADRLKPGLYGDEVEDPTGGEGGEPEEEDGGGPKTYSHGDSVRFTHGEAEGGVRVAGEGRIVGSGPDGVRVATEDGREHKVRFEHLEGAKPKGGAKARAAPKAPVSKALDAVVAFFSKADVAGYYRRNGEYVPQHEDSRQKHRENHTPKALVGEFNHRAGAAGHAIRLRAGADGTFEISYTGHDGVTEHRVVSADEARRLMGGFEAPAKADHHAAHRAVADAKRDGAAGETRKAAPLVVFGGGDAPPAAPMVAFAMAVEARAAEAPPAEPAEPAPPEATDGRLTYLGRAFRMLRNAWSPK